MDKGAHFYKCDFQIHSPRDGNWVGQRPTTDVDRLTFARAFISKCREKGFRAIAITDHHDICFIKYIQLAAQDCVSLTDPLEVTKQNPIVFPGVELTLQIPCQALVLLDANSDRALNETLLQCLGLIPFHDDAHPVGPQPTQIPGIPSLIDLDKRLQNNARLMGESFADAPLLWLKSRRSRPTAAAEA